MSLLSILVYLLMAMFFVISRMYIIPVGYWEMYKNGLLFKEDPLVPEVTTGNGSMERQADSANVHQRNPIVRPPQYSKQRPLSSPIIPKTPKDSRGSRVARISPDTPNSPGTREFPSPSSSSIAKHHAE